MLAASSGTTDNLVDPRPPLEERVAGAWQAAYRRFDDKRLAGAAVMLRAAGRVVLTGAGAGLDAAGFGAAALQEAGFDARATHAADITAARFAFDPTDVIIGVDTGRDDTPAALARARALGLHTIGLTDQDLTLIDSDVLVHYADLQPNGVGGNLFATKQSPLAACAIMALLAARAEPAAPLAFEVAAFNSQIERLGDAREPARDVADHLLANPGRLLIAADGPAAWVAAGVARRINARRGGSSPLVALAVHPADISGPHWSFRATDYLIALELDGAPTGSAGSEDTNRPRLHWRIGGSHKGPQLHTRLQMRSPALASLGAHIVLELLLDELLAG